MRKSPAVAPVAAIFSSVLSLTCCLPLGFLGAVGASGAALLLSSARPWLLALSGVFLGLGFFQVHRGVRCGIRPGKATMILLGLATVLVLVVVLMPQVVAGFLADFFDRVWQ